MKKELNSWIAASIIALILVVSMLGIGLNAASANGATASANGGTAGGIGVAIQITQLK